MTRHGQQLIEYAVLIAAVSLGVALASNFVYKWFLGHAQSVEQGATAF